MVPDSEKGFFKNFFSETKSHFFWHGICFLFALKSLKWNPDRTSSFVSIVSMYSFKSKLINVYLFINQFTAKQGDNNARVYGSERDFWRNWKPNLKQETRNIPLILFKSPGRSMNRVIGFVDFYKYILLITLTDISGYVCPEQGSNTRLPF